MKNIFLLFILFSQITLSQSSEKKTFRMVVLSPENAEIPEELNQFKDSILNRTFRMFNEEKKRLKGIITSIDITEDLEADYAEQTKKNAEVQLKYMDSIEPQVKNYRFYNDLLYSVSILNMAFNEYEPFSEIYSVPYSKDVENNFESYCVNNNLDYILFFDDIKASNYKENFKITSTLKLYSNKEKKVIINKRIDGDTNSYGDMWTCGNPLSCLLITTVKNSLENVIPEIIKRQK